MIDKIIEHKPKIIIASLLIMLGVVGRLTL